MRESAKPRLVAGSAGPLAAGLLATIGALLAAGTAEAGGAQTDYAHDNGRKVLEDAYVNEYSRGDGIYQAAPVTHVVPSFKTVTFALQSAYYNVKMKTDRFTTGSPGQGASQQLVLNGQTVAPYVAVSLSRFGLGFSGEEGTRTLNYSVYDQSVPSNAAATYAATQSSQMQYRAVGVYAYLLPLEAKGEQPLLASVVLGVKEYNVNHSVSPISRTQAPEAVAATKFRYNITEYTLGTLVEWRILKRFSLMPWLDWSYTDVHDPVGQADSVLNGAASPGTSVDVASCLKGDTAVFWDSRPRVASGLDLVARLDDLAIHFGAVFGFLLNTHNTDVITDTSFKLGLSFDVKGD